MCANITNWLVRFMGLLPNTQIHISFSFCSLLLFMIFAIISSIDWSISCIIYLTPYTYISILYDLEWILCKSALEPEFYWSSLHKKWTDMVPFSEEILSEKLQFLCSAYWNWIPKIVALVINLWAQKIVT